MVSNSDKLSCEEKLELIKSNYENSSDDEKRFGFFKRRENEILLEESKINLYKDLLKQHDTLEKAKLSGCLGIIEEKKLKGEIMGLMTSLEANIIRVGPTFHFPTDKKVTIPCDHVLIRYSNEITYNHIIRNKDLKKVVQAMYRCPNCGMAFVKVDNKIVSYVDFLDFIGEEDLTTLNVDNLIKLDDSSIVNINEEIENKDNVFYAGVLYLRAVLDTSLDASSEVIARKMETLSYKDEEEIKQLQDKQEQKRFGL